jgi:hypothetical protein
METIKDTLIVLGAAGLFGLLIAGYAICSAICKTHRANHPKVIRPRHGARIVISK